MIFLQGEEEEEEEEERDQPKPGTSHSKFNVCKLASIMRIPKSLQLLHMDIWTYIMTCIDATFHLFQIKTPIFLKPQSPTQTSACSSLEYAHKSSFTIFSTILFSPSIGTYLFVIECLHMCVDICMNVYVYIYYNSNGNQIDWNPVSCLHCFEVFCCNTLYQLAS